MAAISFVPAEYRQGSPPRSCAGRSPEHIDTQHVFTTAHVRWTPKTGFCPLGIVYGEKDSGWKVYFDYCCRKVGGRLIVLCDYEISKLRMEIPLFYIEVFKAWQDIRRCRYSDTKLIDQIIFNNIICLKGKTIFIL